MTVTDDRPTRADLLEQLGHLVTDARRCHGTPYYGRRHQQINDTLDNLGATPCQYMSDVDLTDQPDFMLDVMLDKLYARHPGDTGPDLEQTKLSIATILTEFSRRNDEWMAGRGLL